jgi:hypothetical protein
MCIRSWTVSLLLLCLPALADQPAAEAPKQENPANDIAAKQAKEMAKHEQRLAKIARLEQLAAETAKPELGDKAKRLRDKEQRRHERVLARLANKEAGKADKKGEDKKNEGKDEDKKGEGKKDDKGDKKEEKDSKKDDQDDKKGHGKGQDKKDDDDDKDHGGGKGNNKPSGKKGG